jgi:hypothetical protein
VSNQKDDKILIPREGSGESITTSVQSPAPFGLSAFDQHFGEASIQPSSKHPNLAGKSCPLSSIERHSLIWISSRARIPDQQNAAEIPRLHSRASFANLQHVPIFPYFFQDILYENKHAFSTPPGGRFSRAPPFMA